MLVVRVNDFDIPSDENDYDELIAFADTMASIEQFEAIPRADYEARLKADLKAILVEIQLEIEEKVTADTAATYFCAKEMCTDIIQQKINTLRGNEE